MTDKLTFRRAGEGVAVHAGDSFIPRTQQEWDQLKALLLFKQAWLCDYCDAPLTWSTATFDHLIPRAQSGTDHCVNLAMACRSCNSRKGARTPLQWLDPQGAAEALKLVHAR